ncbi:MAG: 50S ribosomal protein L10 [Planctomycetia bacterium]|nr:50S ribosomal protein L10 [Planctomycetia bacterium]
MSKTVKNYIIEDLKKRLNGVENALLVNVIGLDVNTMNRLRTDLLSKNINILVIKNSLAHRAAIGTPLESLFKGLRGTASVCYGAQDIVALAKELVRISKDKAYAKFQLRGGVMDGEAFAADKVIDISKWPSREEQISILLGQIVGVGSKLSSQLLACGANLASQFEQLSEKEDADAPKEETAV